jgi:hypothetical protein
MNGRPERRTLLALLATGASLFSCAMVFHSPQESHLPCQRPKTAPQFWQTKVRTRRDMGSLDEKANRT